MVKRNVVDFSARRTGGLEDVLERLFHEHGAAVRSFLLGRVRSEIELDDIVQEVFLRLARNEAAVGKLLKEGSSERAYLFTAANNLVVDLERRRSLQKRYLESQSPAQAGLVDERSPEVVVGAAEELDVVREAIKGLKPTWRTAFILSRIKAMNYKDISAIMGVSVRQVEKYIAGAIRALRHTLPGRGQNNG